MHDMSDSGDLIKSSDEQIAKLIQTQEDNTELFSILVDRYQSKMMRYGRRLLFNHSDIEDVVQEIFIKAYINFQSFDSRKKFSSWLYRIAHNEFINHGKKFSRQLVDYFDLEVFLPQFRSGVDLEKEYDRNQLMALLDKHIADLEDKYQEPLILYAYEQLSYKEISEVMRIPISTVGIRIKRGREILKQFIKS